MLQVPLNENAHFIIKFFPEPLTLQFFAKRVAELLDTDELLPGVIPGTFHPVFEFHKEMYEKNGFFFHFVDINTGARVWNCEISSIDTAWFLAGALLAGEYYHGDVEKLSKEIFDRVNFQWLLTDGELRPDSKLLCHGWTPERGFLPYRWDNYSEHMILYILAISSTTHPISPSCWKAWNRSTGEYKGYRTFAIGPLFCHQYNNIFIDFRNKKDSLGYDYFQTTTNAILINRQFCLDNSYGKLWGLSACDGPNGYQAYGAPPGSVHHDGTISPWAVITSMPFTPEISLETVQYMYAKHRDKIWGRYGFVNAFNIDKEFWDQDVIGIDVGTGLLMLENYRSQLICELLYALTATLQIHPNWQ